MEFFPCSTDIFKFDVFLLHNFAHFVHALRLFKAQCLLFLTNFPGPMLIPCPTFIPDSRVVTVKSTVKILSIIVAFLENMNLSDLLVDYAFCKSMDFISVGPTKPDTIFKTFYSRNSLLCSVIQKGTFNVPPHTKRYLVP